MPSSDQIHAAPASVAAEGAPATGVPSFHPDELVVTLSHARLVLDLLDQWSCAPRVAPGDEHRRLRLARVTLDAAAGEAYLGSTHGHADRMDRARRRAALEGYVPTAIDLVSQCLRSYCADQYGGWAPVFGKNRHVTRSLYVIDMQEDHGYEDAPEWVFGDPARPATIGRRPDRSVGDVIVDVIDTAAWNHPWLSGGLAGPTSALLQHPQAGDPEHATFVAGVILRQAPGATVRIRDVFGGAASGESWTLACAIADLVDKSPRVVNLSLGCLTDDAEPPLTLTRALECLPTDTVVVAAAGNDQAREAGPRGCPRPDWPAALPGVVAVGAVDDAGVPPSFSPYAPWIDVVAPGVDVVSTAVAPLHAQVGFARWSGTSFAAAAVSGALAAALDDDTNPRSAWEQFQERCDRDAHGRPRIPLESFPAVAQ